MFWEASFSLRGFLRGLPIFFLTGSDDSSSVVVLNFNGLSVPACFEVFVTNCSFLCFFLPLPAPALLVSPESSEDSAKYLLFSVEAGFRGLDEEAVFPGLGDFNPDFVFVRDFSTFCLAGVDALGDLDKKFICGDEGADFLPVPEKERKF